MQEQTVPQEAAEKQPYTAKAFLSDVLDIIGAMLTSVFVVMLLFAYVLCIADVDGTSMVPTLQDQDRLLVMRLHSELQTGDIVILDSNVSYTFDTDGSLRQGSGLGKRIVKRVIAAGGQEVSINFAAGTVTVDGVTLDEPYINETTHRDRGAFSYPFTVPEGYLFVMGDNRNVSRDSRDPAVGLLPLEAVVGKAVFRLTPLSGFGSIG